MLRTNAAARRPGQPAATAQRAGTAVRLAAYVVDWLIFVILGSTLVSLGGLQLYLASGRNTHGAPDASIYAFFTIAALTVPIWLLGTLAGWSWYGRSLGKLALGLRIIDRRGRPPGLRRALLRLTVFCFENVFLLVAPAAVAGRVWGGDQIPVWLAPSGLVLGGLALAALLPILISRGGRALHDLAAGTVVVEE